MWSHFPAAMAVLNFYHLGKAIPDNAVYIGRASAAHHLPGSPFANPFPVNAQRTREESIALFRDHLWKSLREGRITETQLLALEGKDLVCYCAPKPCHGHVVAKAVEWAVRRSQQGLTGTAVEPCHSHVSTRPKGP